jgi:hypothetical protein
LCCGCFDSLALHPQAVFSAPKTFNQNSGVASVPMIDSGRTSNPAQNQTVSFSAYGDSSPMLALNLSERQITINAEYQQERLLWLEQAIASGRTETWLYYQIAELAAALGQTEKAQRYLRIAMTRGWQEENSTLTHYGELRNG